MFPMNLRWLNLQKLLLGLLLLAVACQIYYNIAILYRPDRPPRSRCLQTPAVQLEQNGEYWIYHGFMRSRISQLQGNTTITLTTHGTYRDFDQLRWLLPRWKAPISLAVYVQQNDLAETLHCLQYLAQCTVLSISWTNFVSVQLVFPEEQVSRLFHRDVWKQFERIRCRELARKLSKGTQYPHNASYPINLLRNVARLNAGTFYILSLDPGLLPTQRFIEKFLRFAHNFHPVKPLRSVYCIPIFPQVGEDFRLPMYKSQLVDQMMPFIHGNRSLPPNELQRLQEWTSWLAKPERDLDIDIHYFSVSLQKCAAYVSANADQPFYDQRYTDSIYDANSSMLQLMAGLDFDFIVLDGTFLIRRNISSHPEYPAEEDIDQSLAAQRQKHIREQIKLKAFPSTN